MAGAKVAPAKGWERARRRSAFILLALPLLVMALLFAAPLGKLILLSIEADDGGTTLSQYGMLWRPAYRQMFLATLQLSAAVTILCVVLSYPIAYLLAHVRGSHTYWVAIALLVTLWLSTLARTFGWVIVLQRNGVVNDALMASGVVQDRLALLYNWTGVYIGMVHILMPFMIVSLVPALRAIDPNVVRAALSLGATPWTAFRRIYLPLSMPGIVAGSILVFVMALGFFTTPAILGGGRVVTVVMAIRDQVQVLVNLPLAAATSIVLLAATLMVLVLYERVAGVDRLFKGRG